MTRHEREYRRLPGRGRKRGGFFTITRIRASLWAGKDHLLCLFSTGYTEEYKRFYYRDIQAIVLRKTGRGTVWSILSALFLLLFAALATTATITPLAVVFWISAGFSSLILIVNLLRGPTCICHLQTAVSREELPSLGRQRNAEKTINLLKPLIEGAQGTLTREEITAGTADLCRQDESNTRSPSRAHTGATAGSYGGKVHEALFYLLLLDGIFSGAHIFFHSPAMGMIGALFGIIVIIVVIVALTRQQDSLTRGLRGITWSAFSYIVVILLLGYVSVMSMAIKDPAAMAAIGNTQWQQFKMLSSISPAENPVLMFVLVLSVACSIPVGISGLVLLKKFQRERNALPVIQPPAAERSASSGRSAP